MLADVATPPTEFNFAAHLLSLNAGHPERVALIDDHGPLRYGELEQQVQAMADGWIQAFNARLQASFAAETRVAVGDLVELWKSALIPEGPMVVRSALPQEVKDKVIALTADLHETDKDCAYGVAAGEAKDFIPVTLDAYTGIIEARKLQEASN